MPDFLNFFLVFLNPYDAVNDSDVYLAKLVSMIDQGAIRALEVMVMDVPCCAGLVRLAREALAHAGRRIPLRVSVVGIAGQVSAGPP